MAFTTTADLLPRIEAGDKSITDQEVFDAVATHLYTQREPSRSSNGNCAYRGLNHTSCAVGCVLPDAAYRTGMEGTRVLSIADELGDTATGKFLFSHFDLLNALQIAHDNFLGTSHFAYQMRSIAAEFNLDPACAQAFEPEYLEEMH